MRYPVDAKRGFAARAGLILLTTTALAAAATAGHASTPRQQAAALPANGPQADYPVTIGAPYVIDGTTFRPADVLNYDEVGFATAGEGAGITGAHHTLPVPSYVEVTSLESGRTILLRLERRGPMASTHLVSLSPAAMAQLGATDNTPVRVRRVNAPESQRALLRAGEEAPLRMDTPRGLVEVLRRRLPAQGSVSLAGATPPPATAPSPVVVPPAPAASPSPAIATATPRVPTPIATVDVEPSRAAPAPLPAPSPEREPEQAAVPPALPPLPGSLPVAAAVRTPAVATPAPAAVTPSAPQRPAAMAGFVVQAGAFSVQANAQRAARQVGGQVSQAGNLFRVRTGPFATRAEAEASLANVRAAGYNDARIQNGG